jgi:HK97 family phage prohead protease
MVFYRSIAIDPIGKRSFRGIAASAGLKADGLALSMAGADLSRVRGGTMALLMNHNADALVGRITSARTTHDSLFIDGEFPPEGVSPRADEACALLKSGFLNNISAAFDPIQIEPMNPKRPREGRVVTKWALLEASLCAVPVDPESVVTARARVEVRQPDDAAYSADYRRRQAQLFELVGNGYQRSAEFERRQRQRDVLLLAGRWH